MPPKVNQLRDMKIHEVSLVTAPASPGADVILTKAAEEVEKAAHDVSGEPRDARGRWATWGASDLVTGAKGAAREMVRALSDRAKAIGESVVGRTVSGVRTTRPTGAYPVNGGGVQFDFEHTLNRVGAKFRSSVQIRPEHVAGESRAHRGLQHSLALTEKILRTSSRQEKPSFGPGGGRFSFLRGVYEGAPGSTPWQSSPAPATNASASSEATAVESRGPNGIPLWTSPETAPPWVGRIMGSAPAGAEPLSGVDYRTAGGKSHYHRGDFIPRTRADYQMAIAAARDWLAANPSLAENTKQRMQFSNTRSGEAYFTESGDFIPTAPLGVQNSIRDQYRARRQRNYQPPSSGSPAVRLFPPGGNTEYPADLSGLDANALFSLKEKAEKLGHGDEARRLDTAISNLATRLPDGSARGGFRSEERFDKGAQQTSGFDRSLFGAARTPRTKYGGSHLDYAQRVAKSKIKRN